MNNWNIKNNSFTDYINACVEFSNYDFLFDNFKRDERYTAILEHQHIPKEYGDFLIGIIENSYDKEILRKKIDQIKENDKYGNPILYDFDYGQLSLGTIRYIKNSIDIHSYFGSDIKTICEIGGGYGGLCKTIHNFIEYEKYYLFDLEEVNLLSSKYLSRFDMKGEVNMRTLERNDGFKDGELDLVISNYAFSELPTSTQIKYMDDIITKSKRFYLVYNHLQYNELEQKNGLLFNEFCDILSDGYHIEIQDDVDTDLVKIIYGKSKQLSS